MTLPRTQSTTESAVEAMHAVMRLPVGARVAVAMSGGVDSSVVAGLLAEAGYRVFGLTARLYDVDPVAEPRSGTCCAPEDARDARGVAQRLGIRHYVLDEREVFRTAVIDRFVGGWDGGETPNPCVECNRTLKFERLVQVARELGAQALATGHYARLEPDADGRPTLRRAVDNAKDQAYFLYPLGPAAAPFVRFPLGGMTKKQVRGHAARLGLPVADKPESMDVCFVGALGTRVFVEQRTGARPGLLVDLQGTRLGQHAGLAGFTPGQRHGLGLPSAGPDAQPRYVVDKRADGTVVVGQREDLRVRRLELRDCTWLSGQQPAAGQAVGVQVRHRGQAVAAHVTAVSGATVTLEVAGELLAAARGQSGVLFDGDAVLGGGTIAASGTAP